MFVPSNRMRNGDFSECDPASPNANSTMIDNGCVAPTNPATGLLFPGDIVPVDPNATALVKGLFPAPNSGVDTYVKSSSTSTNWRQEQIRVDQNIGDTTRIFVRYTQDAWDTLAVPALWSNANVDSIKTPFFGPGKSAVLNISHSFKPNLMNEFVMGYTVDHILLYNQAGTDASGQPYAINKPSTWTMKNFFPANAGNPLLPSFDVSGGLPDSVVADASNIPWFNSNPIITWKDNLAWMHGKHTTKIGVFVEKYRKNEQFGSRAQGYLTFDGGSSISTGNGLADAYLGRIASYNEGTLTVAGVPVGGYPKGYWRMTAFEPYIQDDWKLSRKLTLNLGLRYYLFTRIHDVAKPTVDSGFIPDLYVRANEAQLDADGNLIQGSGHNYTTFGNGLVECGTGAILKGCQTPYYWTLAPRFGFAFDPFGTGKTVIRGGYGIYYEMGNGNEAQTEGGEGNPPVSLGPTANNIIGFGSVQPVYVGGMYNAPLPPTGYTPIPYTQKWGSVQQFSLGVQHEFPGNNIFSLSYVGALGRHLARNRDLNQIPIGVSTVNVPALADENHCDAAGNCDVQSILINHDPTDNADFFRPYRGYTGMGMKENTAVSNYNALQADFRHVVGHGLTLAAAYTWSHSIDDSTNTYSGSSNGTNDYDLKRWRGTSDLNRTQVLTLNYVYEVPFFKNSSGPVKSVLGGWTFSGISSFFTGQPRNFSCGVTGYSTGVGTTPRCNTVGKLQIKKGTKDDPEFGPIPTWYDPSVTIKPFLDQLSANGQPGMFGYLGRNVLTGPGRNNWDLALLKNFSLPWFKGEHSTVQFRWETFNSFNHPQWNHFRAGCSGSIGFGGSCATGKRGEVDGAWAARIMQLGLKFLF